MEIFYILPKHDYFSKGYRGRVTHALGVANGLSENKNNVTIFSSHDINYFQKDFDKNIQLVYPKSSKYSIKYFINIFWIIKLFNTIKLNLKNKKPSIVICRYAVRNIFFNYFLAYYVNKQSKSVLEINSLAYHQYNKLPIFIRKIILWIETKQLKNFNILYVVSNKIKDDLKNNICKDKIIVTPNAFGGIITNLQTENSNRKSVRLIFFGKYQPYYDYQLLISTYKDLKSDFPHLELHFWGDGRQLEEILRISNNDNGIVFHGYYDRKELNKYFYKKNDILILPLIAKNLGEIVSPIKMYEYMSLGLPIIASDVGQTRDIFTDGINGFYYNPGSIDSLYNTIKYCIKNPNKRILVGQNSKKDLLKYHTWTLRMKKLVDTINASEIITNN